MSSYLNPAQFAQGNTGSSSNSFGGGGSFLSSLLASNGANDQSNPLTDIGTLLGKSAQADASNRFMSGQFQQNADRTAIDAQANERANNAADLKQLTQTGYILGGGSKFKPGTIMLNGHSYPMNTMGLGPAAVTPEQLQGAQNLQSTLLGNLSHGGSLKNGSAQPTPVSNYTTPSAGEKAKGFLGGAASGAGIGATFGPIGAGVGGVLGGLLSLF